MQGRRLALVLGALAACSDEPGATLYVDVRTDLVFGDEFSRVETLLADEPIEPSTETRRVEASGLAAADLAAGARVAELDGVANGTRYVRVRLLTGDGRLVLERDVVVNVAGDTAITVVLSRRCGGVVCPRPDDDATATSCLGGRCVDPRCSVETPEHCGDPECTDAPDCPGAMGCLEATCAAGVCLVAARDERCAAGEHCAAFGECIPTPMDGGPPPPLDGGARDGGVIGVRDGGSPPRDGGGPIDGGTTFSDTYCPNMPVLRQQIAVYLVKYLRGTDFEPPPATGYFTDVEISSPFAPWIEQLRNDGITAGCGDRLFCPAAEVSREAGAVLIMRALYGGAYVPPPATGTVFTDVPATSPFAPAIEQLARDEITAGCAPMLFCPTLPLTRAQIAILIVRMDHGPAYEPPPATGLFTDVDPASFEAAWIEQFARDGYAVGCSS